MEHFIKCVIYLGILGIMSNVVGEAIPRKWISPEKPPFACRSWERNGRVYEVLKVRLWKDHLPDMSRVMKKMVPKRLTVGMGVSDVERLIEETCVAELIHSLLIVCSFVCLTIWPGKGGVIIAVLFSVGNVPFIIIQRYNRPKLRRLLEQIRRRKDKTGHSEPHGCVCESVI